MEITYTSPEQDLMIRLEKERKIAVDFQDRRRDAWLENYELYRNKVNTNRLTQRQAVNIPLMKETVKTLLSQIDDEPNVEILEKDGDLQKTLFMQEKWQDFYDSQKLELLDIQDKKNVLIYGRSFKKLNWADKKCTLGVLDIYDVVVDPLANPLDVETARFLIHQHIYKTVRQILADSRYDDKAKAELKKYLSTQDAVIQGAVNKEEADKRNERLEALGVESSDFDKFGGGDVIVHICEHYTKLWNAQKKKFEWTVCVYANDRVLLLKDTLKELLGIEELPFVTWVEDIETQDFWPDSAADTIRTPNKLVNIWLSQMTENRTLRNFQMQWYDSTIQGYTPQTYEPGPGRMLPAPGDPSKTIKPVEVSGLDDTMAQIEYIIKVSERATGATAIDKGTGEQQDMTLGEVEILVGKAMERAVTMTPFYRNAWKATAEKWIKILEANDNEVSTLYKKASDGKLYPKKLERGDWYSDKGFKVIVSSSSEQESEKTKTVQRYLLLQKYYPNNAALSKIIQKKLFTLVDMTPEEIKEVQDYEDRSQIMQQQPQQNPEDEMMRKQVEDKITQLSNAPVA